MLVSQLYLLICIRAAAGIGSSVHVACRPGVRPGIRCGAGAGVCSRPFAVVLNGVVVGIGVRRCWCSLCWHSSLVFIVVGIGIRCCECWCSSLLALAFVAVGIGIGTHRHQWSLLLALAFVVIGVGVFSSLVLAFIIIVVSSNQYIQRMRHGGRFSSLVLAFVVVGGWLVSIARE